MLCGKKKGVYILLCFIVSAEPSMKVLNISFLFAASLKWNCWSSDFLFMAHLEWKFSYRLQQCSIFMGGFSSFLRHVWNNLPKRLLLCLLQNLLLASTPILCFSVVTLCLTPANRRYLSGLFCSVLKFNVTWNDGILGYLVNTGRVPWTEISLDEPFNLSWYFLVWQQCASWLCLQWGHMNTMIYIEWSGSFHSLC